MSVVVVKQMTLTQTVNACFRYIRQNFITDFNVSESVFNSVRGLRAFESDQPPVDAVCTDGTWRSAHNVSFCVVNATTASVGTWTYVVSRIVSLQS
jgi:hypothetical protein